MQSPQQNKRVVSKKQKLRRKHNLEPKCCTNICDKTYVNKYTTQSNVVRRSMCLQSCVRQPAGSFQSPPHNKSLPGVDAVTPCFRLASARKQTRSGQVRSGRVRSGQGRAGQGRSGQVGSGQVGSGQVRSGQVRSGGSGRVRSGQVGSGRVRSGQVGNGRVGSGHTMSCHVKQGQAIHICVSDTRARHFYFYLPGNK